MRMAHRGHRFPHIEIYCHVYGVRGDQSVSFV